MTFIKFISLVRKRIDVAGVSLYMLVYKQPDLLKSIVRYFIPTRFKVRFIYIKQKSNWGFRNDKSKQFDNIRLVHIVPPLVLLKKNKYLGSFKDIASKRGVFKTIYSDNCVEYVAPKGPEELYYYLKFDCKNLVKLPKNVIFYLDIPGSFGKSVRLLRKLFPHAVIIFRSHNAEGKHSFEKFLVSFNIKWLIKSVVARFSDNSLLKNVDYLDSISRYDIDSYWSRVAGNEDLMKKIRHLPFFYSPPLLPEYFLKASTVVPDRSSIFACFGSIGKSNVLNNRGVKNLIERYLRIKTLMPDACFLVTGNRVGSTDGLVKSGIDFVGVVDDPNVLLASSNYLIDISSIGYGFKTKFLDAALCGCRLVLSAHYLPRLPLEYYPFVSTLLDDGSVFDYSMLSRDDLRGHALEINSNNYSHAMRLLRF